MADMERKRLDLERAQRHLEAAQAGVAMTRRTIEQLELHGRSTAEARRTLQRLEGVVQTMSSYQRAVLRSVEALQSSARSLPPEATRLPAVPATCRVPTPVPSHSSAAAGRPS
jgi:multidrug resistance efflux pump